MALTKLSRSTQAFLASDSRFERCPADVLTAVSQVELLLANECEDAMFAASQERWLKANTYSYDAARKAASALLLAHGWRVRNGPGAHQAVVAFVEGWIGTMPAPGPRIAKTFAASRKARHDDEYPYREASARSADELRTLAEDDIRLMNAVREALGLAIVADAVPTKANVRRWGQRQA